ncbi:restriction endonuclease [Pseudomonas sp. SCB32]|uniref:restriction endonuclease n=1 Tax=Pseudomonas sp. SCB32 TaxID=2653853 RepID=UPI0012644DFB|nr:restriction endonuclease [Pseudomonas sp. SCB32]
MIYQCNTCKKTTFETNCPWCTPSSSQTSGSITARDLTPLDPSFYPDFQYKSKGIIQDFIGKKKEQAQLNELLSNVLRKYSELKKPYFTNFIHTTRDFTSTPNDASTVGARIDGTYSDRELFREVLIRKGFNELEGLPKLLDKLLLTTAFNSIYSGFSRELSRHIKPSLRQTLTSWIQESGTTFRSDLSLFFYFLWENNIQFSEMNYNHQAVSTPGTALLAWSNLKSLLMHCEKIHFDILVNRLGAQLENFNPNKFVTMYLVDAMDGFQFEDFLVKIFQTIGYDVEETKRTADQGADLFVSRFGKKIVIQAKNYSGSVGNSAVQQAISAKAFYGCDEAMVVTNSYFTNSAKELANSALVRLIDRAALQQYLDDYNQKIIEEFESDSLEFELPDLDNIPT